MKFVNMHQPSTQPIAVVTLNRPEVRNAFDPQMIAELKQSFLLLGQRQDLRAIVLRGQGKVFCAGGDLAWMQDMVHYSAEKNHEDADQLFDLFSTIYNCHVPVIGVVQGAAFGGALGLLACCDYVISEEKTRFCFSEVKLGIAPAVISAFVLKKCSMGHISHLLLTGQVFSASEAKFSGLVHEICDEETLEDRLQVAVGWMLEVGPEAVRATKSLIHRLPELSWDEAKEEAAETIAERRVSAEGQEGLLSFLQKRKPRWIAH